MEYHMVLVYTGNQLQLQEDTDLRVLGFVLLFFLRNEESFRGKHCRLLPLLFEACILQSDLRLYRNKQFISVT